MNTEQQLLYMNNPYFILAVEQEYIVHPAALGLTSLTKDSMYQGFTAAFEIKDYQLLLKSLTPFNSILVNFSTSAEAERAYRFEDFKVSYNGAVLIGCNKVKDYRFKDSEVACFSYQKVYELIFEDGILITTIDHSKAMTRIRKNIELGLRCLLQKNDQRCIRRFINSALVGDYKPFLLKQSRYRYLKEMKKDYASSNSYKQILSDTQ